MREFEPPRRGGKFKRADLVDQLTELRRVSKMTIDGGTITNLSSGLHISIDRKEGFWAEIRGESPTIPGHYSWREVFLDFTGETWFVPDTGRESVYDADPAVEINYSPGIITGTMVWLQPPIAGEPTASGYATQLYPFTYGGSGGGGVGAVTSVQCVGNVLYVTYGP